jgi:hypothetical protein
MATASPMQPTTVQSRGEQAHRQSEHDKFILRYGSLELDVPRSVGYFGGLAVAVGLEVIDPPLALFIAAVPFVKMLDLPRMLTPVRFVSHVLQGAAKPVGSDADGVVRIEGNDDE